jgi:uncharacterized protein (DUF2236 family)
MSAPTSVGRKINREGVVLLGWGRAILLQVAHPLVAAAVSEFSDFNQGAAGYLRRVHRTVGGMLAITFGTPEQAQAVIDRINGIHDEVHGALPEATGPFPAGTRYSARDPELLLWVHATLVDSMLVTYERLVGSLSPAERDAFCIEAADTAMRLGVPAELIPRTHDALARYLDRTQRAGEIVVTPVARIIATALLSPPLGPPGMPLAALSRLVTIGLLPAPIRLGYGFEWNARRDRKFRVVMGLIRRTRWALPPMLREWRVARASEKASGRASGEASGKASEEHRKGIGRASTLR